MILYVWYPSSICFCLETGCQTSLVRSFGLLGTSETRVYRAWTSHGRSKGLRTETKLLGNHPGWSLPVYTKGLVSVSYGTKINRVGVGGLRLSETSSEWTSEGKRVVFRKSEATDGNSQTLPFTDTDWETHIWCDSYSSTTSKSKPTRY